MNSIILLNIIAHAYTENNLTFNQIISSIFFTVIYAVFFSIFAQTFSAFFRIRCGEPETQSAFLNFKKHSAVFVIVCQFATVGILLAEFQKSGSQICVMWPHINNVSFFIESVMNTRTRKDTAVDTIVSTAVLFYMIAFDESLPGLR